jgi:uncharacterized protein YjdB
MRSTRADTQFTATVLDDEGVQGENAPVVWTSSDERVATVDEGRLVEAIAAGVAKTTATRGRSRPRGR